MSDDPLKIPVQADGVPEAASALERVANAIRGIAGAARQTHAANEDSRKSFEEFLTTAAGGASAAFDALGRWAGQIEALGEKIAELTAEQQQLERTATNSGLSWEEAADSAGRYVSQLEVMAGAQQFATAGIHLTQQEIDALTQNATRLSQELGGPVSMQFDRLFSAIVGGEQEGLRRFGTSMVALSGQAHTTRERLDEFIRTTASLPRATDDAATSVERFRGEIETTERVVAHAATTSFVALLTAQTNLTRGNREAGDSVADTTAKLRALGSAAGETALTVLRATQGLGGGIVAALVAPASVFGSLLSALHMAEAGNFSGAATELRGIGTTGILGEALANAREGVSGTVDLLMGNVTPDDPARAAIRSAITDSAHTGGDTGDTTADGWHTSLDERTIEARRRVRAGGGSRLFRSPAAAHQQARGGRRERGASADPNALETLFSRAFGQGNEERSLDELMQSAGAGDPLRSNSASTLRADENVGRGSRDDQRIEAMNDSARAQREQRQLQQRYEAQRTFTDRWVELHERQTSAAQHAAESISGAFESLGKALSDHFQAVVAGRESVGQALEGVLGDTLTSIGKEAAVKGGMETAEGLAALAGVVTAGLAPGHFAAAGAYFGVAGLAGLAGAALTPSSGGASGGGSAAPARDHAASSPTSTTQQTPAPVVHNYYAPVIGGREAPKSEVADRMNRFTRAADARLQRSP